ncbi:DUF2730 family protein [Polymorphum gilvum]|uniref:Uncharacterized protein n=1 Tax=Polymorphum gilvum (strain LMG 25793 / CGMCC 1.9160 / SL003B-26A1) TaxID=991905 RepID=F2J5M0_POLGS|nr:DUF2730 family protein [Polymorphum gilvum]ADZ70104.1 hypothetical protein SL003B_1676 [Polymorphum gilvum SL003B-26A1]
MQEIKEWLGAVATALSIGAIVYTWLTARSRANSDTINSHERKLREHDRRLQKVENEVDHLPTKDDFNELSLKLERSNGLLGKIEAEYKGLHEAVRRIEKYLLSGKGQT